MFQFNENQTQAEVTAAIVAGGFTLASFAVVQPDTQYTTGSVTVLLMTDEGAKGAGYRTAVTGGLAGGKTYVAGLVNAHASLATAFNTATVDDGTGTTYTLGEVQSW